MVSPVQSLPLGQVGYRFAFGKTVVYIDPYLSDSVEGLEGPGCRRMFPAPFQPDAVADADWVLITHIHLDHFDPETIKPLSAASPQARFMAPSGVRQGLADLGISADRIVSASESVPVTLAEGLTVQAVPAAHPDVFRDAAGDALFVGYVIDWHGHRIYHAGDTSLVEEVMQALKELAPIRTVFLPVNERNYFRDRLGIIGNMTVREAFGLAEELGAEAFVPMHWDMFAPNAVPREEIELIYRLLKPRFRMLFYPDFI